MGLLAGGGDRIDDEPGVDHRVDPRGPDVTAGWTAALPTATDGEPEAVNYARYLLDTWADPSLLGERLDLPASEPQVHAALGVTAPAFGHIPVIDDDGFILSESMAINCYLAKKHKSPLLPADPKIEALVMQGKYAGITIRQNSSDKVVNKIGLEADEILNKDIELNNVGAEKAAQDNLELVKLSDEELFTRARAIVEGTVVKVTEEEPSE